MKVSVLHFLGLLSWWKPPAKSVVFNFPLATGWEDAVAKPASAGIANWAVFFILRQLLKLLRPRPSLVQALLASFFIPP